MTVLLDLGSTISLARPSVMPLEQWTLGELSVTCVHRHVQEVPAGEVHLGLSEDECPLMVGVFDNLPVPLLIR